MTANRRILLAFLTDAANMAPSLLLNVVLLRQVAGAVSPTEFGRYGQVLALSAYLGILQLGLDFAAGQRVAAHLGAGDPAGASRAYRQLRWFNRLLATVMSGVVVGGVGVVSAVGPPSGVSAEVMIGLVGLTGATQVVAVLTRTASAGLIGAELTHLVNVCKLARMTAVLVVGLLLVRGGWGVLALPIAELLTQAAAAVVLDRLRTLHCRWSADQASDPWTGWPELLRFGLGSTIGGLAWTVEGSADVFLLDWLPGGGGPAAAAAFTLWWRFPAMAFTVGTGLNYSAFPTFARLAAHPHLGRAALARVAGPACGLAAAAVVGLGGWLAPFVSHWLQGQYDRPDGPEVALLMGLVVGLRLYGNMIGLFYLASGRTRLTTAICWLQLAVKIGLSVWWVPLGGLSGLLAASAASATVQVGGVGLQLWRDGLLAGRVAINLLGMLAAASVAATALGAATAGADLQTTVVGIGLTAVVLTGGLLPLVWAARQPVCP